MNSPLNFCISSTDFSHHMQKDLVDMKRAMNALVHCVYILKYSIPINQSFSLQIYHHVQCVCVCRRKQFLHVHAHMHICMFIVAQSTLFKSKYIFTYIVYIHINIKYICTRTSLYLYLTLCMIINRAFYINLQKSIIASEKINLLTGVFK